MLTVQDLLFCTLAQKWIFNCHSWLCVAWSWIFIWPGWLDSFKRSLVLLPPPPPISNSQPLILHVYIEHTLAVSLYGYRYFSSKMKYGFCCTHYIKFAPFSHYCSKPVIQWLCVIYNMYFMSSTVASLKHLWL